LPELLTDNNGRGRETEAPAILDQMAGGGVDDTAAERAIVAAEAVVEASQQELPPPEQLRWLLLSMRRESNVERTKRESVDVSQANRIKYWPC